MATRPHLEQQVSQSRWQHQTAICVRDDHGHLRGAPGHPHPPEPGRVCLHLGCRRKVPIHLRDRLHIPRPLTGGNDWQQRVRLHPPTRPPGVGRPAGPDLGHRSALALPLLLRVRGRGDRVTGNHEP